jgi:hypothetical protein
MNLNCIVENWLNNYSNQYQVGKFFNKKGFLQNRIYVAYDSKAKTWDLISLNIFQQFFRNKMGFYSETHLKTFRPKTEELMRTYSHIDKKKSLSENENLLKECLDKILNNLININKYISVNELNPGIKFSIVSLDHNILRHLFSYLDVTDPQLQGVCKAFQDCARRIQFNELKTSKMTKYDQYFGEALQNKDWKTMRRLINHSLVNVNAIAYEQFIQAVLTEERVQPDLIQFSFCLLKKNKNIPVSNFFTKVLTKYQAASKEDKFIWIQMFIDYHFPVNDPTILNDSIICQLLIFMTKDAIEYDWDQLAIELFKINTSLMPWEDLVTSLIKKGNYSSAIEFLYARLPCNAIVNEILKRNELLLLKAYLDRAPKHKGWCIESICENAQISITRRSLDREKTCVFLKKGFKELNQEERIIALKRTVNESQELYDILQIFLSEELKECVDLTLDNYYICRWAEIQAHKKSLALLKADPRLKDYWDFIHGESIASSFIKRVKAKLGI